MFRFIFSLPKVPDISADILRQKLEMTGLVYEETEESEETRKIKVKITKGPDELIGLKILITNNLQPAYSYGDLIQINGKIQRPAIIQDFDYPAYLARFKIYLVSYKPHIKLLAIRQGNVFLQGIYSIKMKFAEVIKRGIPEPESSLFAAMVFGIKTKLPAEVAADFSRVGLTHIMAISGQNMTIIAGLLMNFALALRLSRRQAFWLASAFLIIFTVLIGLPASAVRASIMSFLVLWAMSQGRLNRGTNAVVLAAVVMLIINPRLLRDDIGFQLSFLAVLGLIYVSPVFEKIFRWLPEALEIRSSIAMTLSAQVFSLPIIIHNFNTLSLVSPLANVLVLPVFSFLLTLGLAATLVAVIFWPLGQWLFWPCNILLMYIVRVCHFLAGFPLAALAVKQLNIFVFAVIYLFLIILLRFNKNVKI